MSRYAGANRRQDPHTVDPVRLTGEHSAQSEADTNTAVTHSGPARRGQHCHFSMGAGKAREGNPGRAACPGG